MVGTVHKMKGANLVVPGILIAVKWYLIFFIIVFLDFRIHRNNVSFGFLV